MKKTKLIKILNCFTMFEKKIKFSKHLYFYKYNIITFFTLKNFSYTLKHFFTVWFISMNFFIFFKKKIFNFDFPFLWWVTLSSKVFTQLHFLSLGTKSHIKLCFLCNLESSFFQNTLLFYNAMIKHNKPVIFFNDSFFNNPTNKLNSFPYVFITSESYRFKAFLMLSLFSI